MKRRVSKSSQNGHSGIEKQYADALKQRQESCLADIQKALTEHRCEMGVVVTIAGQQVALGAVLNFPPSIQIVPKTGDA